MNRLWLRYVALVLTIVLLNALGAWLVAQVDFTLSPKTSDFAYRVMLAAAVLYVVAMAMPFVPGIEIGLLIMLATGPGGVAFVYVCTLLALALAFLAGRFVPLEWMSRLFGWLHLERARRMIAQLAGRPPDERLAFLLSKAPAGWGRRLLVHRYIAAAAVLNLPGNAAIGGAGGIALIAGMSRLFRFSTFMLTMAVAITPVPIVIVLTR